MNKLTIEKRAAIIRCLCEGNSIRSTARITGRDKETVQVLLEQAGDTFSAYQDEHFRDLPCERLQCDEIWSFCYAKQKNAVGVKRKYDEAGDVWTWTALCADTKLIPCWLIGNRDAPTAHHFIKDLAARLAHRVQLTTDGHKVYLSAVAAAFEDKVDYAMLVKLYGVDSETSPDERRYSPAKCMGTRLAVISGEPAHEHISTSFAERANLTIRMQNRRFTRLTNAFSKKMINHERALALYFMFYNFARKHQTLGRTPAVEAGVTGKPWTIEEMCELIP